MKKILAVAMLLVMLAALVACDNSKGDLTSINDYVAPNYTEVTDTGYFTFAEAGGNTAVITGYVGKAEAHAVVIPSQVTISTLGEEDVNAEDNIRTIVGIADNAFYYCTAMISVQIPDTVKTIGNWAFAGCTGLTQITLPNDVTTIGVGAFHGCDKLTSITLSAELLEIKDFAFYGCNGLTSIALPSKLTTIGTAAFFGCQGLTAIDIPASTTVIGDWAFYQCNHLAEIKINTTAEEIEFGDYIFWSELKDIIQAPEGSKAAEYVDSIVISGVGEEETTQGTTAEGETTEPVEDNTEAAE